MIRDIEDKLRAHIEKIVPLSDQEFEFISGHFTVKNYRKKDLIIRKGESVQYLYFVISGLLMLSHNDDQGKQHIVSFAMEDWWETDTQAWFTQTKATMSLQCLEDTEVYCLSLENYKKLRADLKKTEHFFLEKSNAGHIGAQRRILSFLTSNAKERYEQLLKHYPSLYQRVPKILLAAYLGVSRETLSRLYRASGK